MDILDNITINEHSSIRIAADKVIYFDPFHIKGEPHDADIIFITHDHYDHFSPEDIEKISNENTVYAAPDSMAKAVRKAGIRADRIKYMKPGERTSLMGFDIEAVPAYNILKQFHPKMNGWLGYNVDIYGTKVYVCGDTDDIPEGRLVMCDIICVPIGGTFTMDPKSAAIFTKAVMPPVAIPTHYGSVAGKPTDADDFEQYLNGEVRCVKKIVF